MIELARLTSEFAQPLDPISGNGAKLTGRITTVRITDLPHPRSFANGLELDCAAFLSAPLRWLLDDPEITFGVEADALVRKSDRARDVSPQVESGTGDRIGNVRFLVLLLRPFMMCAQRINDSPDRTVTVVRSRRFLAHGR